MKILLVLLVLAIVVVPELPQEFFLARDPATGQPYYFIRGHVTVSQFHFLWAFVGWSKAPLAVRLGLFGILLGVSFLPSKRPHAPPAPAVRFPWWMLFGFFVLSSGAFYAARVPYHVGRTFGDAASIPGDIARGMVFPAELLTSYAFIGVQFVLSRLVHSTTFVDAIALTSAMAGGMFVASLFLLAQRWCRSRAEQAAMVVGCLLSGYVVMFLGYVETTQVELAMMMALFACAAYALIAGDAARSWRWEIAAMACSSLAFLSHAAGILLIPACAVVVMNRFDGRWEHFPWISAKVLSLRRIVLGIMIVLLPYFSLLVQPFFFAGNFGNITGGADQIMFVPLRVDYAHPASPLVSYSLFSLWHLADIVSAVLIAAPLSVPLLAAAFGLLLNRRLELSLVEKRYLLLLGVAAAGCLSVPLLWNHDFGMWGDWNLAATYLFPLNCFAWVAFTTVSRHAAADGGRELLVPLLLVQAAYATGMVLQLT
jgi:hypothetical protein